MSRGLKKGNREKLEEWYANEMTEQICEMSTADVFGQMGECGFIGAKKLTDEELLNEYLLHAREYDRGSLI